MVLNAQMGKAGPPMDGKDLHIGDFASGILPASAPLAIATLTMAGMAMAFCARRSAAASPSRSSAKADRRSASGTRRSTCAPRAGCRRSSASQNNQTALSTPVADQSAVRVFADKAAGYGIPGITIDGTDPDAIAAAFAWAAERARAGLGPALIELVCMRMCGHAHHDDMLYLGRTRRSSWDYPPLTEQGYADRELYAYWARARSDCALRGAARGARAHRRRRSRIAAGARPRRWSSRRRAR